MQSKTMGVLRAMGDLFVGSGRVRLYDRKPETRDAAPGLANQKSPGNRNVQELLHLEQGLKELRLSVPKPIGSYDGRTSLLSEASNNRRARLSAVDSESIARLVRVPG